MSEPLSPSQQLLARLIGDGGGEPEALVDLLAASRELRRASDRDSLVAAALEQMGCLLRSEFRAVFVCDADGTLRQAASVGVDSDPRSVRTVVARVRTTGVALLLRDSSTDRELSVGRDDREPITVVCVPIAVDGDIVAVAYLDRPCRNGSFDDDDLRMLRLCAGMLERDLELITLKEDRANRSGLDELGQLSASIAHDFNNLLMAILGIVEVTTQRADLPPAVAKDLELVRIAAQTGADTVHRLRGFTGVRASRADRPLDVDTLVNEVADLLRPRLDERDTGRYVVRAECDPGLPQVFGNPSELREVLFNLATNAAEAMPRGGPIRLRAFAGNDRVTIEVEDEGPGIPSWLHRRVLEPFFTTKADGHGLGLSISHEILSQMGGKLDLSSSQRGTTARVRLPIAEPVEQESRQSPPRVRKSCRVLVVDDDDGVRAVVCRLLESLGHASVGVCSGREALDLLAMSDFDVVLSDHRMPGMAGLDLAREIRARFERCRVVILTGWSSPELMESHDIVVVHKPITRAKLDRILREVGAATGVRD